MSARRRCRGAFWYEPEAGARLDGEVPNLVQGESGGDDGVAAVLAGDRPAPSAVNTSFASAAPVGGAAVAAARFFGRQRVFFAGRGGDVFGREHGVGRDYWPF